MSPALIILEHLLQGQQLSEDLAAVYLSTDLSNFGVGEQDKIEALAAITQVTAHTEHTA